MNDDPTARRRRRDQAFALVGPGRAGTAVAVALVKAGWRPTAIAGRARDSRSTRMLAARLDAPTAAVADAGRDADLVVIATPDRAIDETALLIANDLRSGALVIHLCGARGLEALAPIVNARDDVKIGALHPLQTLSGRALDDSPLRGAAAAVAGPEDVSALARELGLHPFHVDDADRAAYHAAACVASNHLVALLAQVERLATTLGLPADAFAPLVRTTVDNAFTLGAASALTGPVARGDRATVAAHLDALPGDEQDLYRALASEALVLSGRDDPELAELLTRGGVPAAAALPTAVGGAERMRGRPMEPA